MNYNFLFTCSQEYSYIVTNIEEIAKFCSIESQNVRLGKVTYFNGHLEIFNDHKMENFVGFLAQYETVVEV